MVLPITPVILAGGSGERLWPLSTRDFPKQFTSFDASGQSLFQQTIDRVADRTRFTAPIIVCNEAHRFIVTEQLAACDCEDAAILIEPQPRNTAPALMLAALHAPKALLLVLPSDHRITQPEAFIAAVERGIAAAQMGHIVTFACMPTGPETGYGYIEIGSELLPHDGVHQITRFTEKPAKAQAESYLSYGNYGWNSGMFLLQAETALSESTELAPDVLAACRAGHQAHMLDLHFIRPDAAAMLPCPSISIDYALMEKTSRGAVIPVEMGWSDLGSWGSLHALAEKDAQANHVTENIMLADCSNSFIHSPHPVVAIGLQGMVVVSANEGLLIAPIERLDEIKPLLQQLPPVQASATHRPWGHFQRVDHGSHYQVKKLHVKPGGMISLQSHTQRAEHWVVVDGVATVTNGDRTYRLAQNESTFIPAGTVHRLENREAVPLEVIEIQTGAVLDEGDITRLEDAYNRG